MSNTPDWTNPASQVTPHFTVHDCCFLPSWGQLASPGPDEQVALLGLCQRMEQVRSALGDRPIITHVTLRPPAYNAQVGGAPMSAHIHGKAMDFHVVGVTCDAVRGVLEPLLEGLGMRMERRPGSDWVHLDTNPVPPGGNRYFWP